MWASVRRRPCKKLHISGNALVDGHVLPSANVTYDLGSASLRWRDLYLSGTTIDLGGTAISRDAATGGLKVTDPAAGGAPLDLTVKNLVASNVSVIGDFVTLNTVTSNTEQMIITNAGTGPGLKVTQTGAEAIAEFYDDAGALAMKVADGGNVGIGTAVPRQKLDVNGVIQLSSNVHNASGRPILKQTGSVLNVVNQLVGTTGQISTNQNIITVSITPSSTSSKILVIAAFHGERSTGTSSNYILVNLYRDGTNLLSLNNGLGFQVSNSARQHGSASYLDSPNTTSAVSYKIYADFSAAGGANAYFYGVTLTCMEIAG